MDSSLQFVLVDAIEGPIVIIVLFVNVFSINYYFIIPGAINIVAVILLFMYSKKAIVNIKQLDLKLKSPLFSMVRETLSGLIGIRIYNRRLGLLKQFSKKINNSLRGNLCFWSLSRVFSAFINIPTIIIMGIGWVIGIAVINMSTAQLYQVSVVFLLQMQENFQWVLRQIIGL